jgi:hypothetical protein
VGIRGIRLLSRPVRHPWTEDRKLLQSVVAARFGDPTHGAFRRRARAYDLTHQSQIRQECQLGRGPEDTVQFSSLQYFQYQWRHQHQLLDRRNVPAPDGHCFSACSSHRNASYLLREEPPPASKKILRIRSPHTDPGIADLSKLRKARVANFRMVHIKLKRSRKMEEKRSRFRLNCGWLI